MPYQVLSIPRDQWDKLPALAPPPGITPNFIDPSSIGPSCVAAASVFIAIAFIFFSIRVYTRIVEPKSLSWDDLTCFLGLIGTIWLYVCLVINIEAGPFGKHSWNVSIETASHETYIWGVYFVTVISPPTLGLVKISLFLLYLQLFWPFRWLRISVYIGASLTAAFYIATTIVQFYYATPRKGYTAYGFLLSEWEVKANILFVPISAVGLGVDVFLLILPIRCILKLQVRGRARFGLVLVFMTGILACACSLLNIYFRHKLTTTRDTLFWSPVAQLMMSLELDAGISIVCMPALVKALHHHSACQSLSEKRAMVQQTKTYSIAGDQSKMETGVEIGRFDDSRSEQDESSATMTSPPSLTYLISLSST